MWLTAMPCSDLQAVHFLLQKQPHRRIGLQADGQLMRLAGALQVTGAADCLQGYGVCRGSASVWSINAVCHRAGPVLTGC